MSIEDDRNRIIKTLGDDNYKYYVYMLCEKLENGDTVPFYIGKGKEERVWEHEKEKELKELDESSDTYDDEVETINAKYKKIDEITNSEKEVLKVIVKWGLSENEAYMAESALINMYKFINKGEKLTNIVNGHRSEKEKQNFASETKARSLEDFLKECAIEKVNVEEIKVPIFFADIAATYNKKRDLDNPNNDDSIIYDCIRAAWKLDEEQLEYIKYVFALVKGKVVGIYKVDKDHWLRRMDAKDRGYEQPKYEFEDDNKYLSLYDKYGSDLESIKSACEQLEYDTKACIDWGKRFCFEKIDEEIEPEILYFKDKLLNFHRSLYQNEHYNFDVIGNEIVLKDYNK